MDDTAMIEGDVLGGVAGMAVCNACATNALLTVDETAEFLRTTPKAVRNMVHRGKIPVVRLGRRVLVRRVDLCTLVGLAS